MLPIAIFMLYCFIGGMVGYIVEDKDTTTDDGSSIAAGVFWPVTIPVALGIWIGRAVMKSLPERR